MHLLEIGPVPVTASEKPVKTRDSRPDIGRVRTLQKPVKTRDHGPISDGVGYSDL